jgi:hypothetical protein
MNEMESKMHLLSHENDIATECGCPAHALRDEKLKQCRAFSFCVEIPDGHCCSIVPPVKSGLQPWSTIAADGNLGVFACLRFRLVIDFCRSLDQPAVAEMRLL